MCLKSHVWNGFIQSVGCTPSTRGEGIPHRHMMLTASTL